MRHRLPAIAHQAGGVRDQAKARRQVRRVPGGIGSLPGLGFGRGRAVQQTIVTRRHGRLQRGIRDALEERELGEDQLLDHIARGGAHLGLERHGAGFVDPDPVAVAQGILRFDGQDARCAAADARRRFLAQAIHLSGGAVEAQQAREQQAASWAALHQHHTLVRKIGAQLAVAADEFAARAIKRGNPLGVVIAFHTVHDPEGFALAVVLVHEGALKVAGRERTFHALQQAARVVGAGGNARGQSRRGKDEGPAIAYHRPLRCSAPAAPARC